MAGLVDMVDKRIQQINNDLFNLNVRKTELEDELVKLQEDKQDYDILLQSKETLENLKPVEPITP